MSKLQSVLNNFGNHATSGLSDFVVLAYESCERSDTSLASITLAPNLSLPDSLTSDAALNRCVENLSAEFVEILQKESGMPLTDLDSLAISIDFELHSPRVQAKRAQLASHRVSYAYDPIYTGKVSLRLKSGQEYCSIIQSHDA